MKPRTQEELDHVHLAFSSNGKPGLIESIAQREWAKSGRLLDPESLAAFYTHRGCLHTAKLVKFAVAVDLEVIGSSSVDFAGVTQGPFTLENALSLHELYIGSKRQGMTSLVWLACLAQGFDELSKEQAEAFDQICQDFVRFENVDAKEVAPH